MHREMEGADGRRGRDADLWLADRGGLRALPLSMPKRLHLSRFCPDNHRESVYSDGRVPIAPMLVRPRDHCLHD